MRIGHGTIVNLGCMIAATDRIDVGEHCMFANYCFLTDADHRFEDPDMPITWQGMSPKGPVKIGDNCWFGTNCVVTGGVTIGDRTVVGANSVVTRDLPAGVIAAGAPAKVIREIEFRESRQSVSGLAGLRWVPASSGPAPSRCVRADGRRSRTARTAARCRSCTRPFLTGTVSDGPTIAACRCACAFVSPWISLWW